MRLSSEYQDDITGLVYYGYRYFNPATQRWLSRDPIGFAGGPNLYGFVGNDPISRRDILGLLDEGFLDVLATHPEVRDSFLPNLYEATQGLNDLNERIDQWVDSWYVEDDALKPIVQLVFETPLATLALPGNACQMATFAREAPTHQQKIVAGMLASLALLQMLQPATPHIPLKAPATLPIKAELNTMVRAAAEGEAPRIGQALEPRRRGPASDFENSLPGVASDVTSKKPIVPTLQFENPNPRGKSFVKFDGQDCQDAEVFIDRKLNATTKPKQLADILRVAEALKQNPTASLVIEVPDEDARRAVLRLLNEVGQISNPQIAIRIAQ